MTTPRLAIVKAQREKRRKDNVRKTWRNPRFYILLALLPLLLCLSLPLLACRKAGEWIEFGADETEQLLVRLLAPFHRWIDAGAPRDDA